MPDLVLQSHNMNIQHRTGSRASQSASDDGLYLAVRAAFVAQGTSLNRWCLSKGVSRPYAVQVLRGFWTGAKAQVLLKKIVEAAGVER